MNKQTTVNFVSLGCFKNLVDTEVLGGMLEKLKVKIVSSYEQADWVIINTCGFITSAKEESIDEIFNTLEQKARGEIKHVAVFGCLPQRYQTEIQENFKDVDIIWGVNHLDTLAELIANQKKADYQSAEWSLYDDSFSRIIATSGNYSFIKISEGCNSKCSFCSIPSIRGPYRSRTIDSIIREAQHYKSLGFSEINLISQNSTSYGRDISGHSLLPELLEKISAVGLDWVRVLYLMPEEIPAMKDELLRAFQHPSIIPYFDLPFQHISPTLLKKMNRHGSLKSHLQLIAEIRQAIPAAVFRSSFIVGFPGETDADFAELLEFIKLSEIERIGVFPYSDEDGTAAFAMKDKIPNHICLERKEAVLDASDINMENYNKKLLGSIQEFIPLGPWEKQMTVGRIQSQAPDVDGFTVINQSFGDDLRIFPVRINGFQHEMLYGSPCE
jgi:ribosomal protein S12 methylthiotransferase